MKLKETSTEQKLKGAYYTPLQLADIMIGYYSDYSFERVLEPSCGDGVFLDSLYKANMLSDVEKLVAIEIEKDEANKVAQKDEVAEYIPTQICKRLKGKNALLYKVMSLCLENYDEKEGENNE